MRPIEARYEDGVLKPTRSVPLRPGERVRLIVLRQPDAKRWDLARLASASVEDAELAGQGLAEWANRLDSEEHD